MSQVVGAGHYGSRAETAQFRTWVDSKQRHSVGFSDVRIDSRTELVIASDIAKRLGISPQRVNVLASGPGFPEPLGKLGRSSVWWWSSVERWAQETGRLPATDMR